MSKSLLAASACVVVGTSLGYSAGLSGFSWRAGLLLAAGTAICLLGVIGEGVSAYDEGRRDREAELDEEMMEK